MLFSQLLFQVVVMLHPTCVASRHYMENVENVGEFSLDPARCGCHGKEQSVSTSKWVIIKLVVAAGLGVLFMVAEFTGTDNNY